MPLIQGRSKKAMSENVATEMKVGKPQKQSIAIAYSVARKNKKKAKAMAQGGEITAESEKRPMPDQEFNDKHDVSEQHEDPHAAARNFINQMRADIDDARTPDDMVMLHKRYAFGGAVETTPSTPVSEFAGETEAEDHMADKDLNEPSFERSANESVPNHMISTKEDESERDEMDDEMGGQLAKGGTIADHIMNKKKAKAMAEGGSVDLSENADEEPNHEDDLSFEALKKENYSESDGLDELNQPKDSNEHGDDIDGDKLDMIESIRKKMKAKRG